MIDNWYRGEAGFFLERGEALEQAGRLDEAMSEFKRAVHADPGLAEAHMALGFHYRRKNLLSKAAEEFRTAASLAPSYDSYFNLGHVLVDLGQPQEALLAFQKCQALAPGDPAVGYEIGYALYMAGDYAAALAQLQPFLATASDDWELHYLAGSCELALGHYAKAQASFERALRLLPPGEPDDGLQDALLVALRHREFTTIRPEDLKARLYAEFGIVCLGALDDDGLQQTVSSRSRLSYQDLGRMLQRFHALRMHWRWRFDAVVSVDEVSRPLALALAHSLKAPLVEPQEVEQSGLTLLVWASVTLPELLDVVVERVPGDYVTFVAAPQQADLNHVLPDIIGIVNTGPVAMPWAATGRAPQTTAARQILAAVKSLPPDATLGAQVRYYERHSRLRFLRQEHRGG